MIQFRLNADRAALPLPTFSCTRAVALALALALGFIAAAAADPGNATGPLTAARITASTRAVNGEFIQANAAATRDWPSHGLDYAETRFSRLAQVNAGNVRELGLAWTYDLEATRGVEATPLVVDGVMYVTATWSVVHAIDTRTGRRLWSFDPKVDPAYASKGCCDVVNRGVAIHEGKVYLGAFDGRLIALDAASGAVLWQKDTIIDRSRPYTITGAPRVFKGKVIIGNSGADYGVRGYITAYDAGTGEQKWRWFTVPGDPSQPFEDESMARAARSWDPAGKWWEAGGGGTVWDTLAFDPELNLMYVGTGNGSPWAHRKRSPSGGDNLYLASIVALNPDTGQYVWHYQETPGDNWDYTSTAPMILADLELEGRLRKVILHAPKNGFFFVIDRSNGKLISARNFVRVNWATGYDANGRPIEVPEARATDQPRDPIPSPFGAHNWQSMSFNPQTGLVYLPAQNVPINLVDDQRWKYNDNQPGAPHGGLGWNTAKLANFPTDPENKLFGRLIAWDPVRQAAAWTQEYVSPWNGGTLTTAGNLVFQGAADGRFLAYDAATGTKLWESHTGVGAIAAPVTYMVGDKQYVSIAVGWGGAYGLVQRATEYASTGKVFTFALGGKAPSPEFVKYREGSLLSGVKYDPAQVEAGMALYASNCIYCHGIPGVDRGGAIPNLGYLPAAYIEQLETFVFKGPATARGMPDFTGRLSAEDVAKIKAFIQGTADSIRPQQKPTSN